VKRRNRNKLFIETAGLSGVMLNWYGEAVEKLEPYAKAYHSAAQLLIEKSSGEQLGDIGACPVVFLYRPSLELYLKAILILGLSILRLDGVPFRTVEEILNQRHNLPGLWKEFETLCGLLDWEWETEYEACGDIIMELHEKDPGSFCFRYPITMSGDPALEQDFRFDLQNFCARMDEALELLERVGCGVAGILDER
jgi:hypothetical protein